MTHPTGWRLSAESSTIVVPLIGISSPAAIRLNYDQTVDRKANMNDPLGPFFHPVRVLLIDSHGGIRNIYSFGMLDPRLILADARTVLLESEAQLARH
jgi:hypothetical protein